MSEHKTGASNWTQEQKYFYWERRKRGLRGTYKNVTVNMLVDDENGGKAPVPIGGKISKFSIRKNSQSSRLTKRQAVRAQNRQIQATGRGD